MELIDCHSIPQPRDLASQTKHYFNQKDKANPIDLSVNIIHLHQGA